MNKIEGKLKKNIKNIYSKITIEVNKGYLKLR